MYKLSLFGAPKLQDSQQILDIPRRKAQALLAYLAVTQRSHSREALAAFFWPEHDPGSARADLSRILSSLRKIIGASSIQADRDHVGLDQAANLWVDVVHFRELLDACRKTDFVRIEDECCQKIMSAVDLYQADFLAGFTLLGSPAFDDWQLLQTEVLRRDFSWALEKLITAYEREHQFIQALVFAQRWVSLDPLNEKAQRRLMTLYALNGQRVEAHRQYKMFERLIQAELDVRPQPETRALYEQIRTGTLDPVPDRGHSHEPPPLMQPTVQTRQPKEPFIGRAQELAQMSRFLDDAAAGNGRIILVTGGAGRGKTALMEEFAHRAQAAHPELITIGGSGKALSGIGDPYLPFREVARMLACDADVLRAGGIRGSEQSRRLLALLPQTTQAILEYGPHLIDTFLSGRQLLEQVSAVSQPDASWLVSLRKEVSQRHTQGIVDQTTLFGQFTNVLQHLAQRHPILIILDDLQWIDAASAGLLFHLSRSLSSSRILIVGACRMEEVAVDKNGEIPILAQVLQEIIRTFGDVLLDLSKADQREGSNFVNAYLDTEPNKLDSKFRSALFARTGGHPLFTIELLRDMQNRGNLVKDEADLWCENQTIDWEAFPTRIEAVITRRLERLDRTTQDVLAAASVVGEQFTAEVLMQVLPVQGPALYNILSQQLSKRYRILNEMGETENRQGYLTNYQFRHTLFRQYIYRQLSPGERRHLHGNVAEALAVLHADDLDKAAVLLAHHYTASGKWDKAVPYLERAGDQARQRASLPDAVRHYQSALEHWLVSDYAGRAHILRKLGECQWILGDHQKAVVSMRASYDLYTKVDHKNGAGDVQRLLGRVYWEMGEPEKSSQSYQRALEILEMEPESEALAWALAGMSNFYMHLNDYDRAIDLGERALVMARRLGADAIIIQCLCDLGSTRSGKGDWEGMALEQESLERALALNRPHDVGRASLYIGEALGYLGKFEQARNTLNEVITYLRRMQVAYIIEGAERQLAELDWITGHWSSALEKLQPLQERLQGERRQGLSQVYLGITLGRICNDLGQAEAAHAILTNVLSDTVNTLDPRVALLGEILRSQAALNQKQAAAEIVAEIVSWIEPARYLYPNIGSTLLFVCRMPVSPGWSEMAQYAGVALQQLERLNKQFPTPVTTAYHFEGQGWLHLQNIQHNKAAESFERAVEIWRSLGVPYDLARALNGLDRALSLSGSSRARQASAEAFGIIETLAAQLKTPEHANVFMDTGLAREIQARM